jgi:hypothetical protein
VKAIKRDYRPPRLTKYGELRELTRGWGGSNLDLILGRVVVNDDCGAYPGWVPGSVATCVS